jgi:hypothetical protein
MEVNSSLISVADIRNRPEIWERRISKQRGAAAWRRVGSGRL